MTAWLFLSKQHKFSRNFPLQIPEKYANVSTQLKTSLRRVGQRPLFSFAQVFLYQKRKGDEVPNTKEQKEQILTAARTLLEPVVEAQQVELYDLEFLTEYGRQILRLYIEKEGGVTLDDCERITHAALPVLDAHDPIPDAYVLEVSSPGIERKLVKDNHYTENMGKQVEVKLSKPVAEQNNQKKFRGTLTGLESDVVIILAEPTGEELRLPRQHLVHCRLVYTKV